MNFSFQNTILNNNHRVPKECGEQKLLYFSFLFPPKSEIFPLFWMNHSQASFNLLHVDF